MILKCIYVILHNLRQLKVNPALSHTLASQSEQHFGLPNHHFASKWAAANAANQFCPSLEHLGITPSGITTDATTASFDPVTSLLHPTRLGGSKSLCLSPFPANASDEDLAFQGTATALDMSGNTSLNPDMSGAGIGGGIAAGGHQSGLLTSPLNPTQENNTLSLNDSPYLNSASNLRGSPGLSGQSQNTSTDSTQLSVSAKPFEPVQKTFCTPAQAVTTKRLFDETPQDLDGLQISTGLEKICTGNRNNSTLTSPPGKTSGASIGAKHAPSAKKTLFG